jgi:hypothetical protein
MSTSNPLRRWWHIGIMSGVPLLALAFGAGDADSRSLERNIGAGASRKPAAPATAGMETRRPGAVEAPRAGARNHDPCCSDEPPVPRAREAEPGTGPRGTPAAGPAPAHTPAGSVDRRGSVRAEKRPRDNRIVPRSPAGEQRRGGVGALIGITFA